MLTPSKMNVLGYRIQGSECLLQESLYLSERSTGLVSQSMCIVNTKQTKKSVTEQTNPPVQNMWTPSLPYLESAEEEQRWKK